MANVYELEYIDTLSQYKTRVWRHIFSTEKIAIKFAETHFGDTLYWEKNVFETLEYNRADGYCYRLRILALNE